MSSSAHTSTRSPSSAADIGATSWSIRVARAFGGRGYVVVDGLHALRSAIERSGTVVATLEGTRELLTLRRNAEGDLVRAEGATSP
jgi:hypothetical protein